LKLSAVRNVRSNSLGKILSGLLVAAALQGPLQAGPLEDIRALAKVSPAIDLASLKKGQIICTRGDVGDFPRGISLQSCYFIHVPMPTVGNALLHWNPQNKK